MKYYLMILKVFSSLVDSVITVSVKAPETGVVGPELKRPDSGAVFSALRFYSLSSLYVDLE